ncbi:MAG: hypothetical protein BWY63_00409 [Chloroflexi bacterium ADurb.Bin360]|nr:MAG: hypothetical protein BWY63_00409 [Chloroflexi bacterium ADurb.Bin360]
MDSLTENQIRAYRAQTYRLTHPVKNPEDARTWVEERGFILFWPIKGVILPSLWAAVAGERPVPDEHDDPGHITWGWKDQALDKKWWYYAKVLRKRAGFISLDIAPLFYALSENFGSPEEDYLDQYRQGTLTQEAKTIYEALLHEGPLHTIALRKATFMSADESKVRFERALTELQADFKVLPTGVAEAGAWRYAYIYDCTHRHFPWLPERAHAYGIREAQRTLVECYFRTVGAAPAAEASKIFQWPKGDAEKALQELLTAGCLRQAEIEGQRTPWVATNALWEH